MKKVLFSIFLSLLVASVSAQEIASSFLEKYGKDDSMEVVSIGKKMLQMMESLSSNDEGFSNVIKGLDNIMIVTSKDPDLYKEYYNTANELLTNKSRGFEELLSIKDENENLIVMIKESKGCVKELVLLTGGGEKKEFNMISLIGKIDLKTLAKYSEKMNISGLEKLNAKIQTANK